MVTCKPDDLEHPQGENGSFYTYTYGVTLIQHFQNLLTMINKKINKSTLI